MKTDTNKIMYIIQKERERRHTSPEQSKYTHCTHTPKQIQTNKRILIIKSRDKQPKTNEKRWTYKQKAVLRFALDVKIK